MLPSEFHERLHSTLSSKTPTIVHREKLGIVSDCIETFYFYASTKNPLESVLETNMSSLAHALAVLRSLIKSLTTANWIHYVSAATPSMTLETISSCMREIASNVDMLYPGSSLIFNVPEAKWNSADYEDLLHLRSVLTHLRDDVFKIIPVPRDEMLRCLGEVIPKSEPPHSVDLRVLRNFVQQSISLNRIQVFEEIGRGAFSVIYRGLLDKELTVAIKFFVSAHLRNDHFNQFLCEIGALSHFSHPSIITFYGATLEPPLVMVTELGDGGSLFNAIRHNRDSLNFDKIVMNVASALNYIHSLNCFHGDIKSPNIVLVGNEAKLCDFGSCHSVTSPIGDIPIGTPSWSAPEVLRKQRMFTTKVDIFSLGLVMIEILTGELPTKQIPEWTPPKLRVLIEQCLSGNSTERPDASEVFLCFSTKAVTFNASAVDLGVTSSLLFYILEKGDFDLLGDICAEIPDAGIFLIPRIIDCEVKPSLIRLYRSICSSQESADLLVEHGVISKCIEWIEIDPYQVQAIFLLLSLLHSTKVCLEPQQVQILQEFNESDLAHMCLMLGTPYSEELMNSFLLRMPRCNERLRLSFLICLRHFTDTSKITGHIREEAIRVLLDLVKLNNEAITVHVLSFISRLVAIEDSHWIHISQKNILLLARSVFVKHSIVHKHAVQTLLLMHTQSNIFIEDDPEFKYFVVLIRSLAQSSVKPLLADLIMRVLEKDGAADFFFERQIERFLGSSSIPLFRSFAFRILCYAAVHAKRAVFNTPSILQTLEWALEDGSYEEIGLLHQFLLFSQSAEYFFDRRRARILIERLSSTRESHFQQALLSMTLLAASVGANIENGGPLIDQCLTQTSLSVLSLNIVYAAWKFRRETKLLTATALNVLSDHLDDPQCLEFSTALNLNTDRSEHLCA